MGEEDKKFDKTLERASKALGVFKQLGNVFGLNKKEEEPILSLDYRLERIDEKLDKALGILNQLITLL